MGHYIHPPFRKLRPEVTIMHDYKNILLCKYMGVMHDYKNIYYAIICVLCMNTRTYYYANICGLQLEVIGDGVPFGPLP